jgi:hypothetical protein
MIQVPNSQPTNIAGGNQSETDAIAAAKIAATQVSKAIENEATLGAKNEEANFRLQKATEILRTTQIAYADAVATNSFMKESARAAYNNALAGFRDAEILASETAEQYSLAKTVSEQLRTLAKAGISTAADLKAAIAAAKTDDDKIAAVAAAERLHLPFFLPKGWAAQYKNVTKRDVSDKERQALAEKGKAMPDGSYPISTVADLKNAISSYGRAKNPDAVKAHIIAQAKALNAEDQLPASWGVKGDTMDTMEKAMALILCPACMGNGSGCPVCAGGEDNMVTPAQFDQWYGENVGPEEDDSEYDMSKAFGFTTEALLTRDFQKSAAYQNYIFTKGGPGSGAQPGHPFYGNQHTGGMRFHPNIVNPKTGEKGMMRGWKTTIKQYAANAEKNMAAGHAARAAGDHATAAKHYTQAQGAHMGIAKTHEAEAERGSSGASKDTAGSHYAQASSIRNDFMRPSKALAEAAAS